MRRWAGALTIIIGVSSLGTACQPEYKPGQLLCDPFSPSPCPEGWACLVYGAEHRCYPADEHVCGDGELEGGEQCDGASFGGFGCGDYGFSGSHLTCDASCMAHCSVCGNGQLEAGEECDAGSENSLSPNAPCRPDCTRPRCGDGAVDTTRGEECEAGQLGSATCESLGFYSGMLARCRDDCRYDTSTCQGFCGDGVANGPEACDGLDTGGLHCVDLDDGDGVPAYLAGRLGCDANCALDTSRCVARPVEAWEQLYRGEADSSHPSWWVTELYGAGRDALFGWNWGNTVFHFDGVEGSETVVDATRLYDLWGRSRDEVYVAGLDGVKRWDGVGWSTVLAQPAFAATGTSDGALFVGVAGGILRYKDGLWEPLFITDGTIGRLAATSGTYYQHLLATVTQFDEQTGFPLGDQMVHLEFWGSGWYQSEIADFPYPVACDDLVAYGEGEAFCLGGGALIHYKMGAFEDHTTTVRQLGGGGTNDPPVPLSIWTAGPDAVHVLVQAGPPGIPGSEAPFLARYDRGVWSRVDLPALPIENFVEVQAAAGTDDGRIWLAASDQTQDGTQIQKLYELRLPSAWRNVERPTTSTLGAIGGRDRDDFWVGAAVESAWLYGGAPALYHFDGTRFTPVATEDVADSVATISESPDGTLWAQGNWLWRLEGTAWVRMPDPAAPGPDSFYYPVQVAAAHGVQDVLMDLRRTSGNSSEDVLLQYDGAGWSEPVGYPIDPPDDQLFMMAPLGDVGYLTVGQDDSGTYRLTTFDGATWREACTLPDLLPIVESAGMYVSLENSLQVNIDSMPALWLGSPEHVYIPGGDRVYYYDGTDCAVALEGVGFHRIRGPHALSLWGVPRSAESNPEVSGDADRRLWHFDGTGWSPVELPLGARIKDVWSTVDGSTFAVGEAGVVLALQAPLGPVDGGHCEHPVDLYCGATLQGSTGNLPSEVSEYGACGNAPLPGPEVCYRLHNPVRGQVAVRLLPRGGDLDLLALGSTSEGALDSDTCLGVSQEIDQTPEEIVLTDVQVGQRYYFVVDSLDTEPVAYSIEVTCAPR